MFPWPEPISAVDTKWGSNNIQYGPTQAWSRISGVTLDSLAVALSQQAWQVPGEGLQKYVLLHQLLWQQGFT